jgi:hypothetical protein
MDNVHNCDSYINIPSTQTHIYLKTTVYFTCAWLTGFWFVAPVPSKCDDIAVSEMLQAKRTPHYVFCLITPPPRRDTLLSFRELNCLTSHYERISKAYVKVHARERVLTELYVLSWVERWHEIVMLHRERVCWCSDISGYRGEGSTPFYTLNWQESRWHGNSRIFLWN